MGSNGLRSYETADQGIEAVAKLLSTPRYKGKSIAEIGSFSAPVGASNDPNGLNRAWGTNVTALYDKYR